MDNRYRKICRKVDQATADLEKANKNAEQLMIDVLIAMNRKLLLK